MILSLLLSLTVAAGSPAPRPPPRRAQRARANLAGDVSDEDYPAAAIRNGESGTVAFVLEVAADGHVAACRVTASSGSALLDSTTCRIMTARAVFTPARDRRGRPVADVVSNRMRWVLPDEGQAPPTTLASYVSAFDYPEEAIRRRQQGRVGFELSISAEGAVTDCRILTSSGSPALDQRTCEIMRARARFRPARDARGNPVPDTVDATIAWVLPNS